MRSSSTTWLRGAFSIRIGPLRHLPALVRLAWDTSRALTLAGVGLRLVRAAVPALMLYVAKLVVDAVVAGRAGPAAGQTVADWLADPQFRQVGLLIGIEFALALASDLLGRATSLVDGVLGERTGNATSLRLMAHAATLDLAQFEDPAVQDSLAKLVALGEAWSARLDALNERLQAAGPSLELGDSHVGASLEPSPAARGALQAARECLEGLAGGTSLGPTLRAWDALVTAARSESRLRQWAREAGETLRSCAGFEDGKPAMDIKQAQEALEKVLRELQEILQQTPAVKEHLQELVRCSSE